MVGILLITHYELGSCLIKCAEHVFCSPSVCEPLNRLSAIHVARNDDPEQLYEYACKQVERLDEGDGVLVLSDMFGATPANIACRLTQHSSQVRVVTGVSLPMLIRALCNRELELSAVVEKAISGGHEGIVQVPEGGERND